jgi:hypothetical protein
MRKPSAWVVITFVAVLASAGWAYGAKKNAGGVTKVTFEDYLEIQQLYDRYGRGIDLGHDNGETYASAFTEDGVFSIAGMNDTNPVVGHKALAAYAARGQDNPNRSRHVITNIVVTPTAEGVTSSAYFLLLDTKPNPPTIISHRATEDLLVKTANGWRFKKRANALVSSNTPFTAANMPAGARQP